MSDREDATKRLVLARRAKFVAAALAGVAVACGKDRGSPFVCLDVPPPEDAAATTSTTRDAAVAQPCLEVMPASPKKDGGK